MVVLARVLELLATGLALLMFAVIATGGWTIDGLALTRPEDALVVLAVVVAIRAFVAPIPLPRLRPVRVVGVGVVTYVLLMDFVVLSRHAALQTHALDLGQYLQVIWNISAGFGARTTLPPLHFWGEHLALVFYLLVPLMWLAPGATALLVAQTLVLAAGAVAVFAYTVRRTALADERVAAGFALLYLVNPSLHGVNIRDIHPQAFAITFLLGAVAAFDAGRFGWCALALLLTLVSREDAAIAVVGFGIWLALARRRWALGAAVAGAAVLVLYADLTWVMPYFRSSPYPHLNRYSHLGASLPQILGTLVLEPQSWLPLTLSFQKGMYLAALLAPLGFLPLLAPRVLAAALPGLAMNLLSFDHVLFSYRSQYQAFVLPFLVLAAVDGYASLHKRRVPWLSAGRALAFGFVASVVLTARTVNDFTVTRWWPGADQRTAYALMREIPAAAVVSVNERLVPHLATRREVYIFPTAVATSAWILERESEIAKAPPIGFAVVRRTSGWVLLRRES